MTPPSVSQRVLEHIQTEHIHPKARWRFVIKNVFVWGLAICAVAIGALSVSVLIFILQNNDWDAYRFIHESFLTFILSTFPYGWAILLALFWIAADYYFKRTKHGYHYPVRTVLGLVMGCSLLLGVGLYNAGLGQAVDETFAARLPIYQRFLHRRELVWSEPEEGLLAGMVISVQPNQFSLKDFAGRTWTILYAPETKIPPFLNLKAKERVRIIGQKEGDGVFQAAYIKPWLLHERPGFLLEYWLKEEGSKMRMKP